MAFGNAIHPSETAGDGKTIEQSRYLHKSSGDKIDRRVQCAQCGFYVDLDTRAHGDAQYDLDASITTSTGTIRPPNPGISQSDTYGEPQSDMGAGCPLCRSMNVTGVNRGKRFGSGINLENL